MAASDGATLERAPGGDIVTTSLFNVTLLEESLWVGSLGRAGWPGRWHRLPREGGLFQRRSMPGAALGKPTASAALLGRISGLISHTQARRPACVRVAAAQGDARLAARRRGGHGVLQLHARGGRPHAHHGRPLPRRLRGVWPHRASHVRPAHPTAPPLAPPAPTRPASCGVSANPTSTPTPAPTPNQVRPGPLARLGDTPGLVGVPSSRLTRRPPSPAAALQPPSALPQPWASALPLLLGSGPSRFEATRQPSSGPPKAADLRPNPLTGTRCPASCANPNPNPNPLTLTLTLTL